jgi:hypothetical protein
LSAEDLTPWQKGQSGNPSGKPKGAKNRSTVIRELLALKAEGGRDNEYRMMSALLEKACTGDVAAVKEIQDTMYGKTPDKMLSAETTPEELERDVTGEVLKKIPTEELEAVLQNGNKPD